MMRRFTSAPNPRRACAAFIVGDVVAVDAQAVAHAVVAREVRRRFGRRDQVVRRQAVPRSTAPRPARPSRRAASSAPAARSTAARTSGSMPSTSIISSTMPTRKPGDAVFERVGRRARAARRSTSSRSGSWPQIASSSSAASRDGRRERPDLVERRRERDQAVARHRAVRRLHPDDAAQRRGLADRAAGVGAERRAARTRPRPRPPNRRSTRRAPATRRAGCASAPNAEFSVDDPIANSSRFVLPTITAPAARSRVHDGRVVRRPPAFEDRRRARRRDAARAEVVLDRDGHAGERPGVLAARDRGVDRVAPRRVPRRRARG